MQALRGSGGLAGGRGAGGSSPGSPCVPQQPPAPQGAVPTHRGSREPRGAPQGVVTEPGVSSVSLLTGTERALASLPPTQLMQTQNTPEPCPPLTSAG